MGIACYFFNSIHNAVSTVNLLAHAHVIEKRTFSRRATSHLEDPAGTRVNTFLTFWTPHEKIPCHPRQRRCTRHAFGRDLHASFGPDRRTCSRSVRCPFRSTCRKSCSYQAQIQAQGPQARCQSQNGQKSCLIGSQQYFADRPIRQVNRSPCKARHVRVFFRLATAPHRAQISR